MATKSKMSKNGKQVEKVNVPELCVELQGLQRERAAIMKSIMKQKNRLRALTAGRLGYKPELSEKERESKFKEADKYIKEIMSIPEEAVIATFHKMVRRSMMGIDLLEELREDLEKSMEEIALKLPVIDWVKKPEQRGFGPKFLAIVVGEAGDISNYSTIGKLWKRFQCAPWYFDGKELMGSTWRRGKEGKLPASEWERFGYSPRRRSISYLIGTCLVKANFKIHKETGEESWTGPYLAKIREAKAAFQDKHPDYSKMRCNLHGMLIGTKLLLKNLWLEWHGNPPDVNHGWWEKK